MSNKFVCKIVFLLAMFPSLSFAAPVAHEAGMKEPAIMWFNGEIPGPVRLDGLRETPDGRIAHGHA